MRRGDGVAARETERETETEPLGAVGADSVGGGRWPGGGFGVCAFFFGVFFSGPTCFTGMRKNVYVTPKSFLCLIDFYKVLYVTWRVGCDPE